MLTVIIDNSVAIYSTTLAGLLDILIKEGSIEDTQEDKDFIITEYVMESYYMVAQAGGEDELFKSMKSVPLDYIGAKIQENVEKTEVDNDQIADLKQGLENLRTQAEELLPGINRIAKALGRKMGSLQSSFISMLEAEGESEDELTAEETALLLSAKGEA